MWHRYETAAGGSSPALIYVMSSGGGGITAGLARHRAASGGVGREDGPGLPAQHSTR